MAQVKIYGIKDELNRVKEQLSDLIHDSVVRAFDFPRDKKFHRFFPLEEDDFIFPAGRTKQYTIIEISIFEGRSIETKKNLINLIYKNCNEGLAIVPNDIEITIFENPKYNWGIRGLPGDELVFNYKVDV